MESVPSICKAMSSRGEIYAPGTLLHPETLIAPLGAKPVNSSRVPADGSVLAELEDEAAAVPVAAAAAADPDAIDVP